MEEVSHTVCEGVSTSSQILYFFSHIEKTPNYSLNVNSFQSCGSANSAWHLQAPKSCFVQGATEPTKLSLN